MRNALLVALIALLPAGSNVYADGWSPKQMWPFGKKPAPVKRRAGSGGTYSAKPAGWLRLPLPYIWPKPPTRQPTAQPSVLRWMNNHTKRAWKKTTGLFTSDSRGGRKPKKTSNSFWPLSIWQGKPKRSSQPRDVNDFFAQQRLEF